MGSAVLGEAISAIRDWSMTKEGERACRARRGCVRQPGVQRRGSAEASAEATVYHALRRTITHGEPLDPSVADAVATAREGLGRRARRHALHALVPAADRHHRGKARLVPQPDRRRQGGRGVLRQGAGARASRTRRASRPAACAPPSKRAATRRGIRPARPGCSRAAARSRSSFRRRSSAGPAKRSTRKRRCSARWKRSRSRRSAC